MVTVSYMLLQLQSHGSHLLVTSAVRFHSVVELTANSSGFQVILIKYEKLVHFPCSVSGAFIEQSKQVYSIYYSPVVPSAQCSLTAVTSSKEDISLRNDFTSSWRVTSVNPTPSYLARPSVLALSSESLALKPSEHGDCRLVSPDSICAVLVIKAQACVEACTVQSSGPHPQPQATALQL